jgi:hypothetical protein
MTPTRAKAEPEAVARVGSSAVLACCRCGTSPTMTKRNTPQGMRLGIKLVEIECPKCRIGCSDYNEAIAVDIWRQANEKMKRGG